MPTRATVTAKLSGRIESSKMTVAPAARSPSSAFMKASRVSGRSGTASRSSVLCDLFRRLGRGNALKRNACPLKNESRNAEAFSFERVRFQILRIGAGLGLCSGTDRAGIQRIFSGHDAKRNRSIGHVAGDWPGVVEQPVERRDAGDAHQAARWEDADDGAGSSRHPNRVAGVGSIAEQRKVRSDGCDGAA